MPVDEMQTGVGRSTALTNAHEHFHGLKSIARTALSKTPGTRINDRVVVLCYHSIHPDNGFASATPALFEDHVAWLKENYQIIPFSDVIRVAGRARHGKTAVAITFDDGYEDNHSYALPVLVRHAAPATFFVTTAFAEGNSDVVEWLRTLVHARSDEISSMCWTQVRELRAAGMDVGSHTVSHPNLAALSDQEALDEMADSKHVVEDQLNEDISSIAYPFGLPRRNYSTRTVVLAHKAGYKCGAAILFRDVKESDGPLSIPRIAVSGDSIDTLHKKLTGSFNWLGFYQEHAPLWALSALSPVNAPASVKRQ